MDRKGVKMADIIKGRVLSVSEKYVRIEPVTAPGQVSPLIAIPDRLKGLIEKNTEVAYTVFGDASGIVLGRIDGMEGVSE